jgi:serine/threonine protein kinase
MIDTLTVPHEIMLGTVQTLYKCSKSHVQLTENQVILKTMPLVCAITEVMTHGMLASSSFTQTFLGGTVLEDDKVQLHYVYEPLEISPENENDVRVFFDDLVHGIHTFHSSGLAHRDLKFENIRMDLAGRTKLIDFDSVGIGETRCTDITTTIYTRAPEMLQREVDGIHGFLYDPKPIDIWGLGILSLQMAVGRQISYADSCPKDMLSCLDDVVNMLRDPRAETELGTTRFQIVRHCLSYDPLERPKIEDILNKIH